MNSGQSPGAVDLTIFSDPRRFFEEGGDYLSAAEVRNALILGLRSALVDAGAGVSSMSVIARRSGRQIVGVALYLPGQPAVCVAEDRGAAEAIIEALGDLPRPPRRIVFNSTEDELTGKSAPSPDRSVRERRQHVLLRSQLHAGSGDTFIRRATKQDLSLVERWEEAFLAELNHGRGLYAPQRSCFAALCEGRLYLLHDHEPVAMALWSGRSTNGARISNVYTPPSARRRGYAERLTSAICSELFKYGCSWVTLFTEQGADAAERLYQKIGFKYIQSWNDVTL